MRQTYKQPKWLDTKEYPFESKFFEIGTHKMHYIDEGKGPILLFVHGTPSWSFDFRKVILQLRDSFRCIAVDHLGFGLSDKPADFAYSTELHAQHLSRFIAAFDLKDITLVLHDFGGPIGFQSALSDPYRVKNFVFLNSWLWSSASDPDFIKFSRMLRSPLLPFLYLRLNFSPRFLMPATFGAKKLSGKIRKQFTAPFSRASERKGALAFARSLLNDQNWFQQLWNRRDGRTSRPVLLIWGMKDPVIKPSYLAKWIEGFPAAHVHELPSCGHFPQEENPEDVAECIRTFLLGTR